MDINKILEEQSEKIKELEKQNALLKKQKESAQDQRYTFTRQTVERVVKINGDYKAELEKYKTILIELYIASTDNPVQVKRIISKTKDIELLLPEVKNIAYKIRQGEK